MSGNLPDDVRPSDIDKHFREPETRTVFGIVEVQAHTVTDSFDTEEELQDALKQAALEGDIEDVVRVTVEEIE